MQEIFKSKLQVVIFKLIQLVKLSSLFRENYSVSIRDKINICNEVFIQDGNKCFEDYLLFRSISESTR